MVAQPKSNPEPMKTLWLLLLVVGFCGCSHQYSMKLTNGVQITSSNKPKLKGSYFYYKGPHGEQQVIPQSRVIEIQPTSMAKEENKFKVSQPRKKHWYWPF
jgi:hypothetical protein